MTLQASGAISLSQIQTEFTGSNPISLSEYYKSGAYVGNFSANANIPTSGQISASQFYSTSRTYTINATLATNYDQLNLWDWIVATYGTYSVPYAVTFNNNARIYSTNASASAFTTGTGWPSGSTITIVNNSEIIGRGGNGGAGGSISSGTGGDGGAGGTAISLSYPVTIYNNSIIYAGGGGGGGGGLSKSTYPVDGLGLPAPGALYAGGGGGAAQGNGTNGVGAVSSIRSYIGQFERNGADGGSVSAGVGGIGGKVRIDPGGKDPGPPAQWIGGNGGNSAGYGQAGNSGNIGTIVNTDNTQVYSGGSGGAAGYAVQTNGNSLTWATYGTVTGTVA